MKKLFTLLVSALMVVGANASSTYYANYVQVNAYPTGTGKVYVSDTSEKPADDKWEETSEYQYVTTLNSFYLHAQPAEGYQFAGFSEATFDETEMPIFNETIFSKDNPTYGDPTLSAFNGEDEAAVQGMMPLDPNRVYYALFTCVKPDFYKNHSPMGTVVIDKVCNKVGDKVVLTATPNTEWDSTCKFDYWIKESTGEQIKDNPLSVDVKGVETYRAHFSADKALVWNFAEEGEYKMWYNESGLVGNVFPENVYNVTFTVIDTLKVADAGLEGNELDRHVNVENLSSYMWNSHTHALLYGKGEATIILTGEPAIDETAIPDIVCPAEPVNVDELPVTYRYYTMDIEGEKFDLIPAGTTIAAGSYYVQFDVTRFYEGLAAPEVLYWNKESFVTKIATPEMIENLKNSKVYNINGMEVLSAGKGIYIMNGKKFIKK